jgi:hypothetical protein
MEWDFSIGRFHSSFHKRYNNLGYIRKRSSDSYNYSSFNGRFISSEQNIFA